MGGAHEKLEHAEHVEHAAGHNKQIALLIAVLALFLAISETLGKSAQTSAISDNVQASNLWAFFQAKTIRMTAVRTAAEAMTVEAGASTDPALRAAIDKQIAAWRATANRYDDEPDTGEGRKQLMARAQEAEHTRDTHLAKYHHFELASAAFQVGIVLASASVITGIMALAFGAGALSIAGLVLMGIGLFAPHAVHLV
ncbi:MAG: DUF4337 domain-containing protein [Bradyrhizobiaceae bacterium]|nr:DUF4337 domain-containing protein [Bradyrhizobiaceae bacterium]